MAKEAQAEQEQMVGVPEIDGWAGVVVADINPQFTTIPAGEYTFRVVGAGPHKFEAGALNLQLAIEGEGEYRGRRVFSKLKSPAVQPGVLRDIARLNNVMGIDPLPGETPLPFFQRAAAEGGKFSAPLTIYEYTNRETGEPGKKEVVQFSKARPAA